MFPEEKYKWLFNPKSNRFQNYDYGSNWWYFITICTKNRENYFGEIVDWKMILNEIWRIVFDEIVWLEKHFNYIKIDEFIVMPNHIHLILIVKNNCVETSIYGVSEGVSENNQNVLNQDAINRISTEKQKWWITWNKNIMMNKNHIWFIIRQLKWKTKFLINKYRKDTDLSCLKNKDLFFVWQPNYYDRIIRNEDELLRIRQYIFENPLKWELDKNNTENIFM